jgi:hypothetical protein
VLRRASSGRAEAVARGRVAAEDDRDASEECRAVTEGGTPDVGGGGLSRDIWRHAGPWWTMRRATTVARCYARRSPTVAWRRPGAGCGEAQRWLRRRRALDFGGGAQWGGGGGGSRRRHKVKGGGEWAWAREWVGRAGIEKFSISGGPRIFGSLMGKPGE